jgi:hypothetical protein
MVAVYSSSTSSAMGAFAFLHDPPRPRHPDGELPFRGLRGPVAVDGVTAGPGPARRSASTDRSSGRSAHDGRATPERQREPRDQRDRPVRVARHEIHDPMPHRRNPCRSRRAGIGQHRYGMR